MKLNTLPEARAAIDAIDAELQALIARRARVAEQVRRQSAIARHVVAGREAHEDKLLGDR